MKFKQIKAFFTGGAKFKSPKSGNYTLIIGLNDKDAKVQLIDNEFAKNELAKLVISAGIAGCTISECTGVYTHDSREIVKEKSIKLELCFVELVKVIALCGSIKRAFNQESVLFREELGKVEFI